MFDAFEKVSGLRLNDRKKPKLKEKLEKLRKSEAVESMCIGGVSRRQNKRKNYDK